MAHRDDGKVPGRRLHRRCKKCTGRAMARCVCTSFCGSGRCRHRRRDINGDEGEPLTRGRG